MINTGKIKSLLRKIGYISKLDNIQKYSKTIPFINERMNGKIHLYTIITD